MPMDDKEARRSLLCGRVLLVVEARFQALKALLTRKMMRNDDLPGWQSLYLASGLLASDKSIHSTCSHMTVCSFGTYTVEGTGKPMQWAAKFTHSLARSSRDSSTR